MSMTRASSAVSCSSTALAVFCSLRAITKEARSTAYVLNVDVQLLLFFLFFRVVEVVERVVAV
jgi:hypothetical protein